MATVDERADNVSKKNSPFDWTLSQTLEWKEHKRSMERLQKGTVRKWNDNDDAEYVILKFDMLCAGFPCQPFSDLRNKGLMMIMVMLNMIASSFKVIDQNTKLRMCPM